MCTVKYDIVIGHLQNNYPYYLKKFPILHSLSYPLFLLSATIVPPFTADNWKLTKIRNFYDKHNNIKLNSYRNNCFYLIQCFNFSITSLNYYQLFKNFLKKKISTISTKYFSRPPQDTKNEKYYLICIC